MHEKMRAAMEMLEPSMRSVEPALKPYLHHKRRRAQEPM